MLLNVNVVFAELLEEFGDLSDDTDRLEGISVLINS
jgi:hypothetical protein